MSRRLSLNARQAQIDPVSPEIDVVLIEIAHPDLDAPLRLSTDNTEMISDEPRIYGTRSTWRGADPARVFDRCPGRHSAANPVRQHAYPRSEAQRRQ